MIASKTGTPVARTYTEPERDEMVQMWHALDAWPDSAAGLQKLKERVLIAPLSNGSTRILIDLVRSPRPRPPPLHLTRHQARRNALPWDVIFAADMLGSYKPSPAMYRGAARLLGLRPDEVCLIAAHMYDLRAAKEHGMKTVYIRRATEDVDEREKVRVGVDVDAVVDSLDELAELF
jgi:2-haloalkanoic acid dehalogenase type II